MLGLRWTVVSRVSWPRLLHADDDDSWRMSSLSSVITLADTLSRREASNENYQHASPQCRACNDRSLSDTDTDTHTHTHTHCDTGVNQWRVYHACTFVTEPTRCYHCNCTLQQRRAIEILTNVFSMFSSLIIVSARAAMRRCAIDDNIHKPPRCFAPCRPDADDILGRSSWVM